MVSLKIHASAALHGSLAAFTVPNGDKLGLAVKGCGFKKARAKISNSDHPSMELWKYGDSLPYQQMQP